MYYLFSEFVLHYTRKSLSMIWLYLDWLYTYGDGMALFVSFLTTITKCARIMPGCRRWNYKSGCSVKYLYNSENLLGMMSMEMVTLVFLFRMHSFWVPSHPDTCTFSMVASLEPAIEKIDWFSLKNSLPIWFQSQNRHWSSEAGNII